MHLKMKLSRNHTFKDVDHEELKLTICEEHDMDFILFCETRESLACKACITKNHKGHE